MFKNPRNKLVEVDGFEWQPTVPLDQALAKATEAMQNPPESIEFTTTLTGQFAAKLHFVKTLMTSLGLPDEEADKFILQYGIEQQIKFMSDRANYVEEEN